MAKLGGRPSKEGRIKKTVLLSQDVFDMIKIVHVRHRRIEPELFDESELIERAVLEWMERQGYRKEEIGL